MKINNYFSPIALIILSVFLLAVSCSDDETPVDPTDDFISSGFIISSIAESTPGNTFAGYFDQMPSGQLDLVANSQSYNFWRARSSKNGYIYGPDEIDRRITKKFVIDAEDSTIKSIDELILNGQTSGIIFIDENTAVTGNFTDQTIQVFDPETMEVTGEIDMSQGKTIETNNRNSYSSLFYNERVGKIYAVLYTDNELTPQFYDADEVYVEVIDVATLTWEKTIVHPNAEYPIFRGEKNTVIDESGNLYLIAQGQYGLDNQFGPLAPAGSKPQILKITPDSEFDTDYSFNPINALGFQNNFFQLFVTMVYGGNNKAYGIGTATTDDPQILVLLQKFATVGLTDEEYSTLVNLVLYGESMKVLEIDLINRTVNEVSNMPLTAGFGYPFMYNYNGDLYTTITTTAGHAYYQINPNGIGSSKELFTYTTGGLPFQLIDLSTDFK